MSSILNNFLVLLKLVLPQANAIAVADDLLIIFGVLGISLVGSFILEEAVFSDSQSSIRYFGNLIKDKWQSHFNKLQYQIDRGLVDLKCVKREDKPGVTKLFPVLVKRGTKTATISYDDSNKIKRIDDGGCVFLPRNDKKNDDEKTEFSGCSYTGMSEENIRKSFDIEMLADICKGDPELKNLKEAVKKFKGKSALEQKEQEFVGIENEARQLKGTAGSANSVNQIPG